MKSALKISIKPMTETAAKKEMDTMADDDVGTGDSPAEEKAETPEFEKYELDNAVRVLHEAAEIKQDAALMKAIAPMLEKKKKAINSLDDLKAVAKEKTGGY